MNTSGRDDSFYIGYLPRAPVADATFVRRTVAVVAAIALVGAVMLAITLPFFGAGEFEYGQPRNLSGTIRCDVTPRLIAGEADYLLVGVGKHGTSPEICGAAGREVSIRGTLIQRDGRRLVEVAQWLESRVGAALAQPRVPLGRFTLTGEIVDSKCYSGVMNPGEGRLHRAVFARRCAGSVCRPRSQRESRSTTDRKGARWPNRRRAHRADR